MDYRQPDEQVFQDSNAPAEHAAGLEAGLMSGQDLLPYP
jgi:hypothetical protein